MTSIDEKIRQYGQKQNIKALQQLILNLDEKELINLVKSKISGACFTDTWNYLLQSFGDTAECHSKRFKMVRVVLDVLEEMDMPATRRDTITNRLCIEFNKFKSKHLAELCTLFLDVIHSKKNSRLMCKDLLPEVLNVLIDREKFAYNDLEYTGLEYKTDFINSLCMISWSPNIVTLLTSMFVDMPLTKEEHLKLINKLGTYIKKITPQEIPAFVYQLLRLCKQHNGQSIFLRLQTYFGARIYNNADLNGNCSSESTVNDLDIIESADNQDTIDAESTVLYHIHTAASLGHHCIKDYLNSLKNLMKAPEFVLHPFQLMVLLTISTIPHYEETVFDIIRPCIVRSYHEDKKKQHSCWSREMVPSTCKPEEVFSQVIHFSIQDRDLVVKGLVNFGFVLLGIGSGLGRDLIAERQWNLGQIILLKIIKRKRHIALTIIQTICNHIVTRPNVSQYIECLYVLSKTLPLLMLENQSCIVELMESLVQVPANVANSLLDTLIPLTKISPTIRDHLIILLRKALYSRVTGTRQVAVNGFLKLLTNLRISNLAALSQSSSSSGSFSSGHSLFTQISMDRTTQTIGSSAFSNEALCLEVLSILRRCFMQQMEVRAKLYEGLYDAVCMNPELGVPVLDLIWCHFSEYYVIDEEVLPPLNFDKIVVTRESESVLQEPLGKLVYAIGLIVTKVMESEEDRENPSVIKFSNILESLCDRMIRCDLETFGLNENSILLDNTLETQQNAHILKVEISVYEALIGYKMYSWNLQSKNQGRTINSLFQKFSLLQHFFKGHQKPKKPEASQKQVGNSTSTQQSQINITKRKQEQKSPKPFKIEETVLSFECIKKTLSLLHEPTVDWTTAMEANVVKTKNEFHQHVMQVTSYLVQKAKRNKEVETRYKKFYYDHVTDIASILFHRIIERLNAFMDFDSITGVMTVDCFHEILILMSIVYKSNFKQFLNKLVGNDTEDSFIAQLTVLVKIYQNIFEKENETVDDAETKKMLVTVVNTLNILASQIPVDNNPLALQMCDWLKKFCYSNTVSSKTSSVFISLFFETHLKHKVSLTVLEQMSASVGAVMGVITEDDEKVEEFEIINEGTVQSIFLSLCNNIKAILEDVDSVIARLKSEYNILSYPGAENVEKKMENLKSKELGIVCQLCFAVNIMTNLSNTAANPGQLSEAIFKNVIVLFSTLTLFTRHFVTRASKVILAFQGARFERLVKLAGKQLGPAVYRFILHIEEHQKQAPLTQGKKKNVDANTLKNRVLRETRLIPKVVYELEQFSKAIILLSNRTKVDLAKYVGAGTVRDFRIVQLKRVLGQAEEADIDETQPTASHDVEEQVETERSGERSIELVEDVASPPLTKRSKK